ncbi:acyltransferase family protein [Bacillus sinesaloumensis]|uniref:acyltransferase family protein n=1 Tax=Litchfieldia sinesaloumensis TaxID=1926280 RepID=UPI00114EF30D|nr:acyltransferase [Bacillus sinesaloumensis]
MVGRKNNFDIIRFFAATLVIYSHAFPLTGFDKSEPLKEFSKNQTTFGHLGVLIFFVISGFLITQSFDRNKNVSLFIKARILRIFPALIVVVLLSVFVLGSFVTTLSIKEYFTNSETYIYLKSILLYTMQYDIPGVFTTNPYPIAINGSLWTLPIEFLFYFIILFIGIINLLNKRFMVIIFVLSLLLPFLGFSVGEDYIDLFRYFVAGSIFYLYRERISINWIIAMISFSTIVLSLVYGHFNTVFALFGSYLIFYIAYHPRIAFHSFSKIGDASYGLYIFAFPIQQLITYLFNGEISPLSNFAISFPIVLVMSYCSWHLIENPMLKFKKVKSSELVTIKVGPFLREKISK